MSNSSIWSIDRTLSCATTPGQNEPGRDGNEGVLYIPQSSSITGALPSDCLVSYLEYSLGKFYSCPWEIESVYSTAPADWTNWFVCTQLNAFKHSYLILIIQFNINKQF